MSRELDIITKAKLTLTKYKTLRDVSSLVLSNEYNEKSLNFSRVLIWKLLINFNNKSVQDIPILQLIESHLPELTKWRSQFVKNMSKCEIPWDQLPTDSLYYLKSHDEFDIGSDNRHPVLMDPLTSNEDPEKGNLFHLQLIILDVERLFPQEPELFVNSFANRKLIIEILYQYYLLNGGVYRQGMHELIGLIFRLFVLELVPLENRVEYNEPLELQLFSLYESTFLQLDVLIVFEKLLPNVLDQYFDETSLLQESIKFNLKLHELDQMLYHILLNKLKIQTPIWILRYFRLMLLRELGIETTLVVWDKFIAFGRDDITKLVPFYIIIMLLKLRNFILESEHDDILFLLLHYPLLEKATIRQVDAMVQDSILLYNSESNLKSLSKIMVYKYGRDDDKDERGIKGKITLNRSKSLMGKPQLQKQQQKQQQQRDKTSIDDSIGGNQIDIPTQNIKKKDFERTRLELRLAKRVNDLLKTRK